MTRKRFRVVVTDAEYQSHEPERKVLGKLNVELVKFQCRTEDDVIRHCHDADALLNQYAPITRKVIKSLERARIIVRYGVGVDNIDLGAATEKGIFVANVVYDVCDVADHTIALILSLIRKMPWVYRSTASGKWDWREFQPITRLKGKTVGMIGLGRVGKEVAKRFQGFGVDIVAHDPFVGPRVFEQCGAKAVDLETLLGKSDIITIHVPLSRETYHMIGANAFRKMKKTAILVNTCRGPVVHEKALYSALKERRISGAGVDVLEEEPLTEECRLTELDNIIITPHMAWYSEDSLLEIQTKAAEEVARVLSGQPPRNLVNKELLEKLKEDSSITVLKNFKYY